MSFIAFSYGPNGEQSLGSWGTLFANDIKTERGLRNRVAKYKWPERAVVVKCYTWPRPVSYDDSGNRFLFDIPLKTNVVPSVSNACT